MTAALATFLSAMGLVEALALALWGAILVLSR